MGGHKNKTTGNKSDAKKKKEDEKKKKEEKNETKFADVKDKTLRLAAIAIGFDEDKLKKAAAEKKLSFDAIVRSELEGLSDAAVSGDEESDSDAAVSGDEESDESEEDRERKQEKRFQEMMENEELTQMSTPTKPSLLILRMNSNNTCVALPKISIEFGVKKLTGEKWQKFARNNTVKHKKIGENNGKFVYYNDSNPRTSEVDTARDLFSWIMGFLESCEYHSLDDTTCVTALQHFMKGNTVVTQFSENVIEILWRVMGKYITDHGCMQELFSTSFRTKFVSGSFIDHAKMYVERNRLLGNLNDDEALKKLFIDSMPEDWLQTNMYLLDLLKKGTLTTVMAYDAVVKLDNSQKGSTPKKEKKPKGGPKLKKPGNGKKPDGVKPEIILGEPCKLCKQHLKLEEAPQHKQKFEGEKFCPYQKLFENTSMPAEVKKAEIAKKQKFFVESRRKAVSEVLFRIYPETEVEPIYRVGPNENVKVTLSNVKTQNINFTTKTGLMFKARYDSGHLGSHHLMSKTQANYLNLEIKETSDKGPNDAQKHEIPVLGEVDVPIFIGNEVRNMKFLIWNHSETLLSRKRLCEYDPTPIGFSDIDDRGTFLKAPVMYDKLERAWVFQNISSEHLAAQAGIVEEEDEHISPHQEEIEKWSHVHHRDGISQSKEQTERVELIMSNVEDLFEGTKEELEKMRGLLLEMADMVNQRYTNVATGASHPKNHPAKENFKFQFKTEEDYVEPPRAWRRDEKPIIDEFYEWAKSKGYVSYCDDPEDPNSIKSVDVKCCINATIVKHPGKKAGVALGARKANQKNVLAPPKHSTQIPGIESMLQSGQGDPYAMMTADWSKCWYSIPTDKDYLPWLATWTADKRMVTWNVGAYGYADLPRLFHVFAQKYADPILKPLGWDRYVDDMTNFLMTNKLSELLLKVEKYVHVCHISGLVPNLMKFWIDRKGKTVGHCWESGKGWSIDAERLIKVETTTRNLMDLKPKEAKKRLESAIGMLGFISRFVKNCNLDCTILRRKLTNKKNWSWSQDDQDLLDDLVQRAINAKNLSLPIPGKDIILQPDAGDDGLGAALVQYDQDNWQDVPEAELTGNIIGFWSKAHNKVTVNYSTIEHECQAMMLGLLHFEDVFSGYKLFIKTDQRPLTFMATMHPKMRFRKRLYSWITTILSFDFEIFHVKGKLNWLADALSRIFHATKEEIILEKRLSTEEWERVFFMEEEEDAGSLFYIDEAEAEEAKTPDEEFKTPTPLLDTVNCYGQKYFNKTLSTLDLFPANYFNVDAWEADWRERIEMNGDIIENTFIALTPPKDGVDLAIKKLINAKLYGVIIVSKDQNVEMMQEALYKTVRISNDINIDGKILSMRLDLKAIFISPNEETVIDKSDDAGLIISTTQADFNIFYWEQLRLLKRSTDYFYEIARQLLTKDGDLNLQSSELLSATKIVKHHIKNLRIDDGILRYKNLEYVRPRHRIFVMRKLHVLAGHGGFERTAKLIQEQLWWPNWREELREFLRTCMICVKNKPGLFETVKTQRWPIAPIFGRVHIDLMDMETSSIGNNFILDIVDSASRYQVAVPLKTKDAESVAKALLQHWILQIPGTPDDLVSDQGSEFVNEILAKLAEILDFKIKTTSTNHSTANGQVERPNRTIREIIRAYLKEKKYKPEDWDRILPLALDTINSSTNITGFTPYELVTGARRKNRTHSVLNIEAKRKISQEWLSDLVMKREKAQTTTKKSKTPKKLAKKINESDLRKGDFVKARTENSKSTEQYEVFVVDETENNGVTVKVHRQGEPRKQFKKHAPELMRTHIAKQHDQKERQREYLVEKILDSKTIERKKLYLVKWIGWDEPTWEPTANLKNCQGAIRDYAKAQKQAVKTPTPKRRK
jgi:hypothetical protein